MIHIHIFFFRFFSIIGYYKMLSIVPCAIQKVLDVYLFYAWLCVSVNPKFPIYPPFPLGELFHTRVNEWSESQWPSGCTLRVPSPPFKTEMAKVEVQGPRPIAHPGHPALEFRVGLAQVFSATASQFSFLLLKSPSPTPSR